MNLDSHHPSNDNTSYQAKHLICMYASSKIRRAVMKEQRLSDLILTTLYIVFRLALGWGHTLFVSVAEQVTALFVAPFCSERKGERSNERGGLWLTICPLGWGLPESNRVCQVEKIEIKLLVLLVSCHVGDLPTEA